MRTKYEIRAALREYCSTHDVGQTVAHVIGKFEAVWRENAGRIRGMGVEELAGHLRAGVSCFCKTKHIFK